MKIILPWPNPVLNPNNRSHWAVKAKAKAKARADAMLIAGKCPSYEKHIPLYVVFHPPTKRQPDGDNLLASCKAYIDGIAEAWGINDKIFRPITIDFGEPVKQGQVVITIK